MPASSVVLPRTRRLTLANPEAMVWSAQLRNRDREQQLREVLDAVHAYEARSGDGEYEGHRALDPHHHSKPTEAAAIWQAVITGRWSLVEQFDSEGYRCFLATPNPPNGPGTSALSERERQIVSHASRGYSNKHIAYELGLCSSTVAAQLTSAARKLNVSSRETLLHAFAVLGEAAPDRMAPDRVGVDLHGDDPTAPTHNDDHPAIQVVQFRHEDHEYAMIRIAIAPHLPASLTAAEAEVASLAIEGLSNAAIARRRDTSVRTVANQLRSIYSKLAVGSRRQLRSRFSSRRSLGAGAIRTSRDDHQSKFDR
jgi:DNA-binding NarL/FixJ family response regulator